MRGCCSEGDGRERAREGATAVLRSIGRSVEQSCRSSRRLPRMRPRSASRAARKRASLLGCAEKRPGRRLRASERPARDRQGMGRWRAAKDSGGRLCALRVAPDKADAGEERPVRICIRLAGERGRLRFNVLYSAHSCLACRRRGATPLAQRFVLGPGRGRAAGLSEKRSLNKKRGTGYGAGREHGAGLGGKQVFRLRSRSLVCCVIRSARRATSRACRKRRDVPASRPGKKPEQVS